MFDVIPNQPTKNCVPMPVRVKRNIGRPTLIQKEMEVWAVAFLKSVQKAQVALRFTASGQSLDGYQVEVSRRFIDCVIPFYLKFSMGEGRRPGGKMAPIQALVDWINTKGFETDPNSVRSMAFAIAKSQQQKGNAVYQKKRAAIPILTLIDDSFDDIKNDLALAAAKQGADLIAASFSNSSNFKTKK